MNVKKINLTQIVPGKKIYVNFRLDDGSHYWEPIDDFLSSIGCAAIAVEDEEKTEKKKPKTEKPKAENTEPLADVPKKRGRRPKNPIKS